MAAPVRAAYFSFCRFDGDQAAHVAWHQLDHMPEQFAIAAIVHGQRWASTPRCRAARMVADGELAAIDYLVAYLIAEPVVPALTEFQVLHDRLEAEGRMQRSEGVLRGAFELVEMTADPRVRVNPAVLPWRPATGLYVTVAALDGGSDGSFSPSGPVLAAPSGLPGVAGRWSFRPFDAVAAPSATDGRYAVDLWFLDGDLIDAAAGLTAWLHGHGGAHRFAGPFEPTVPWVWTSAAGPEPGT